jgi:hypothetical protein
MGLNKLDFARLVWQMRQAQKKYFKERTQSGLRASKELERKVDEELQQIIKEAVQAKLWTNE